MASNPENTALQETQQNQRFLPEKQRQIYAFAQIASPQSWQHEDN